MIAPHELKRKPFTKAVRGYSSSEVDEYIEFLIDKYTQLYKENAELERKLHVVSSKYEELAGDEESIRSAVLKAQKLSEAIVSNAQKKADDIAFTVDQRCKEVIKKNALKLEEEKKLLIKLREMSNGFRDRLYDQYLEHVKLIRDMDLPEPEKVDEDLISAVKMEKDAMDSLNPKQEVYDAAQKPIEEQKSSGIDPKSDQ